MYTKLEMNLLTLQFRLYLKNGRIRGCSYLRAQEILREAKELTLERKAEVIIWHF